VEGSDCGLFLGCYSGTCLERLMKITEISRYPASEVGFEPVTSPVRS